MEEQRMQAEREAQRLADEEIRRQLEIEAQKEAEEEARRQAELEAQRQAEEEARRQAELEAQRQAEEEARRQAELEAQRQAEEEARRQAEEEARRQAEANAEKTLQGTVTAVNGNTLQIRAEGCNITVLIDNAEKHIADTIEVDDEITVVIKGQMTDRGWNAIKVTDNTSHAA